MSVIRNSARAFIGVMFILAAYHLVMSSLGLATFLAANAVPPSPDRALQMLAQRIAIDGGLLFAGHWLMRSFGIATRGGYGLMGGTATGIGYAFALSNGLMMSAPLEGTRVTAAVLPIVLGMIASSIYAQLAGRETLPAKPGSAAAATPADTPPQFDGPVQVRTSALAILTAAFVPAAVFALAAIPFFAAMFGTWETTDWSAQILQMAIPSYLFMIIVLITVLPAAIVVGITHALARSLRRMRGVDYAVIGAIVSFVAALLTVSYLPITMLPPTVALAGALMGAVYRRFAGLEPLPLPEAVLATDPSHLVGEHHPARRSHAVIING